MKCIQINGGLMCASVVQILIGMTGLIGAIMKFVGPLTIIPTVALVGLSLFETITAPAQEHWGISLG
mgnify:CR=1 FL=1